MEKVKNQGQAVTEYILLLAIVVSIFTGIMSALVDSNLISLIKRPLEKEFTTTYRYGHPDVKGQENGGPKNMALKDEPQEQNDNFRIFINPPIK